MRRRSTDLVLPLSQSEKEFLLRAAEETHLSISDFVLLVALSLNLNAKDISIKLSEIGREHHL